jgi:NAD(P)-dependent dehydrogenase (short-subunit alcohol dehydrogenase family)
LHSEGIEARGVILDVDPQSGAEFFGDALAAFGRIDVLVLNAAANTPNGSLLSQHPEELGKVLRDNVQANLTIVNAVVPQMVERKDGSLIFMSSRAAKRGSLNLGMYAMAKAAVDQCVRNLALELGPSNINVNSINPGPCTNGLLENSLGRSGSRGRYRRGDADAAHRRAFGGIFTLSWRFASRVIWSSNPDRHGSRSLAHSGISASPCVHATSDMAIVKSPTPVFAGEVDRVLLRIFPDRAVQHHRLIAIMNGFPTKSSGRLVVHLVSR